MNEFKGEKDKNMGNKMKFKQKTNLKEVNKSAKGITLIALVITIIVLLILAGVSIATLTGENGILTRANDAKTQNQAGEEKEAIGLAYNGVMAENKGEGITAGQLQDELRSNGYTNATAVDNGDGTITVTFGEASNRRVYTIDANGNIYDQTDEDVTPPTGEITLDSAKNESMVNETENTTVRVTDGTFTLPGGFKVAEDSGETVEEGIVIVDGSGNEFVWVPAEVNEMAQCSTAGGSCNLQLEGNQVVCKTHGNNTNIVGKLYATSLGNNFTADTPNTTYTENSGLREPDIVSDYDSDYLNIIKGILTKQTNKYADIDTFKDTMQEDYNAMIKSVEQYGGFYVSRYEMSKSSNNTAASVGNVTPLVNDSSNMWYGLYAYGKTYTNSANSVESSMIWGSQYDAMMRWMQSGEHGVDVTKDIGNNRNTSTTTKASSTDVIKNVYDLYGCHFEWTLEADDTNHRVSRGGDYYGSDSPSYRNGDYPVIRRLLLFSSHTLC